MDNLKREISSLVAEIMINNDMDFDWYIVDKMNEEILKSIVSI